jgi:radical SAM superfamily enzyme YgiQ (UPF0313 family)
MKSSKNYEGFEVGPIRPPSEAGSLLLRLTRNCPWNRCKFCGLYKGTKFSIRPVAHVLQDIDTIHYYADAIQQKTENLDCTERRALEALYAGVSQNGDPIAFQSALRWVRGGMRSIFLQDANTLVMKPEDLVEILQHIRQCFPQVERITAYARSQSVALISDDDMARIATAGLNRIHIGMESAADEVLKFVKKGVDKKRHIIAGQKVKRAGIELSEYFMPGLGGKQHSRANALETADAINQINPDFIRIRTLAIPHHTELFQDVQSGAFEKLSDVETVEELLLFLDHLDGITSTVKSDHILNLFQEVEGRLPEGKARMTAPIRKFLTMDPETQLIYRVGRRTGIFSKLDDLQDPVLIKHAEKARQTHRVTLENVDQFTDEMIQMFI